MKTKHTVFALLLLLSLILAACAPQDAHTDNMEDSEMASEVMEDKNEEMDKDESMTEEEMEKDESMTEEEMEEGEDAMEKDDDAMMEKDELNLNFENLSALGSDYAYEGWIIVDSAPHSTGIFTVSDDGSLRDRKSVV